MICPLPRPRLSLLLAALALLLTVPLAAGERPGAAGAGTPSPAERYAVTTDSRGLTRPVDVVICLDTSGSMEDLLDSARARVWDVINELARLRPTPELHVGLLTYGTDRSTAADGWIIKQTDFTNDLDRVYHDLMSLTTEGSEEYVGRVLHEAVTTMDWSPDPEALKIIFVAGNESAIQGEDRYSLRDAAAEARAAGIIINALYAGNREHGVTERWPEVARHGAGNFSAIDPTRTIQIPTPQDDPLLALNQRLIDTYLPYGEKGKDGFANQIAQDRNASRLGVQSCSSRIVAKGSALYTNAAWDLVDALLQDELALENLLDEDLPEAMRSMTDAERVAYVQAKRAAREKIQLEIQEVSAAREQYIQEAIARERRANPGLGEAMRRALRSQAQAKGFTCDGC